MKTLNKKIALVLVLLIATSTLCACGKSGGKEQKYTVNDFSVTMSEGFNETENDIYYCFLQTDDCAVTALRESFDILSAIGIDADSDLYEYAKIICEGNGFGLDEIIEGKNKKYYAIEYYNTVEETEYYYLSAMYKGSDSFWLVSFMCFGKDSERFSPLFEKWAATVEVK